MLILDLVLTWLFVLILSLKIIKGNTEYYPGNKHKFHNKLKKIHFLLTNLYWEVKYACCSCMMNDSLTVVESAWWKWSCGVDE
ncbi:hypothetical protein MIDIC_310004 [Alphaproteobacteria bacterium]